ncbi:AGE family epimerase/isomerase [Gluconobacter sp. OJB]|uniref:AGE family epimerase/isomerase n=1 Tax=Gluconobacter sp. OJB TaxID=3145196 RepID=UPI0031F965DD
MVEKQHFLDTTQSTQWTDWMVQKALPLWSTAGYDRIKRLYHERLAFDATPIAVSDLRLMVQARQIATFCRASLDGVFNASQDALTCLAEVETRYWRSDDQPGWVFALGSDGYPSITTRDLYAHAFILFAYAWSYRLSGNPKLLKTVNETITEIESIFQAPNGGFLDTVPTIDNIRRQNPHMHLLEAYLALFEVTKDQFYMDKAQQLITLAQDKFISPRSGMLLEFLASNWTPCEEFGYNTVEPGHLFEWSWLLNEAIRLNPTAFYNKNLHTTAERLFAVGIQHGIIHDVVCDSITDNGTVTHISTRIWPQTELIRLLACRSKLATTNTPDTAENCLLDTMTHTFFTSYAPESLQGGWLDRRNAQGKAAVDHMPASSLYHIYGASREFFKSDE